MPNSIESSNSAKKEPKSAASGFSKLFSIGAGFAMVLILFFFLFRYCQKPNYSNNSNSSNLVNKVRSDLKKADSIKVVIKYRDTIRTKTIVKWRQAKTDTFPCDTSLKICRTICDTIIVQDSLLLSDLKALSLLQDTVIGNLFKVHANDSLTLLQRNDSIATLHRKIKVQKWKTRGVIALWILREGQRVYSQVKD